jgi:hypothetical protein
MILVSGVWPLVQWNTTQDVAGTQGEGGGGGLLVRSQIEQQVAVLRKCDVYIYVIRMIT